MVLEQKIELEPVLPVLHSFDHVYSKSIVLPNQGINAFSRLFTATRAPTLSSVPDMAPPAALHAPDSFSWSFSLLILTSYWRFQSTKGPRLWYGRHVNRFVYPLGLHHADSGRAAKHFLKPMHAILTRILDHGVSIAWRSGLNVICRMVFVPS